MLNYSELLLIEALTTFEKLTGSKSHEVASCCQIYYLLINGLI